MDTKPFVSTYFVTLSPYGGVKSNIPLNFKDFDSDNMEKIIPLIYSIVNIKVS